MATTTNYGWTTPDDTALVKDGASAIRTLGTSVDTTTKNLNPETTLGDISFRSSTSNINTRLGIGGTGTVLTVAAGVPSWATPSSGALVLLNTTTISAATDVTISNVFSSTYTNYKLHFRGFTGFGRLRAQLVTSGTPAATAYNYRWLYAVTGSIAQQKDTAQTSVQLQFENGANLIGQTIVEISGPNLAETTSFYAENNIAQTTNDDMMLAFVSGNHTTATSYDGIKLLVPSGTMTGVVSIYGYTK